MSKILASLTVCVAMMAVSAANADMIGVKYLRGYDLSPTDVVGAPGYTQANWTMAPATNSQGPPDYTLLTNLKDNNGLATSVNVTTWTHQGQDYTTGKSDNGWTDGPPATTEQRLVADYSANWPTIDFSGLNAFAPTGYMVVAYYGGTSAGTVQLTAGAYIKTRDVSEGVLGTYPFAWYEGTDGNYGNGTVSNYTVFGTPLAPLTSDTFTVEMTDRVQGWVGGLAAVQIVQIVPDLVPEPSTLILLGTGLLGLCVARRRRRRS